MSNKKNHTNRAPDAVSAQGAKYYSEEEISALIRSLDRDEDQHIFAQDVLLTYPHLAESYTKVCPKRCDLATAVTRALNGDYSYSPSLAELRSDLQLMVNNCVRFNGSESPLAETAERFEGFFNQKLDEYIQSKTGGRRMSSLRLKQQKQEEKERRRRAVSFSVCDVVSLVTSLVRREDAGAFVVDVAEAYPELRESYHAVCTRPMNLRMVKARAQAGRYTRAVATEGSPTVADSLAALREDVELIVSNCIRFNEQIESWVKLARSFQRFAHRRIDDFVLRHDPGLRGTQSGVERYCPPEEQAVGDSNHSIKNAESSDAVTRASSLSIEKPQSQHSLATEEDVPQICGSRSPLAAEGNTVMGFVTSMPRGPDSNKKKTLKWAQISPQLLLVHTCEGVRPDIKPSPLQPPLHIPDRLRERIVADYLLRDQIRLRLVGKRIWVPFLRDVQSSDEGVIEGALERDGADAMTIGPNKDGRRIGNTEDLFIEEYTSAQAVLDAFVESVKEFYHRQRSRSDFENVFQYSVEDEAVYTRVLDIIGREFNRLLPFAFLYEVEAAELHAWSAERAVDAILGPLWESKRRRVEVSGSGDGTQSHRHDNTESEEKGERDNYEAAEVGQGAWNPSRHVHYSYLVRFLVHFPQIASLCCANRSEVAKGATTMARTTLQIQKCLLDVIKQVTKVVEELLMFIDGYEQQLQNTA